MTLLATVEVQFIRSKDKFKLRHISTVNGFCQFCNKLEYLIKCLVKFSVIVVVYVATTSLVNKAEYIIYYAYTSVQVSFSYDRLARCVRFVYIYACIAVIFMLLPFLVE